MEVNDCQINPAMKASGQNYATVQKREAKSTSQQGPRARPRTIDSLTTTKAKSRAWMLQKFSYINLLGKVWDIKTKTPWFNKEPWKLFKD